MSYVLASVWVNNYWSDGWPPKAPKLALCCSKPKWRGVPNHDDSLLPKTEMKRCPKSWWQSALFKTWHMSPNNLSSIFSKTESLDLFYNGISTHSHRSFFIWTGKKLIWAKTLARCPVTAFPEPGSCGVILTIFPNPKSKYDCTIGKLMICRWKSAI